MSHLPPPPPATIYSYIYESHQQRILVPFPFYMGSPSSVVTTEGIAKENTEIKTHIPSIHYKYTTLPCDIKNVQGGLGCK